MRELEPTMAAHEVRWLVSRNLGQVEALFRSMDVNRNFSVEYEEFIRVLAEWEAVC